MKYFRINAKVWFRILISVYFLCSLFCAILYLLIASGVILKEYVEFVSSAMNALITIGLSTFITFQISKLSFTKQNEDNLKIIATNSLDHSTANMKQVALLIKRINDFKNEKEKNKSLNYYQFLDEIIYAIASISSNIISSQNDLRRIVKDEIKKDNDIILDVLKKIEIEKELKNQIQEYQAVIEELKQKGEESMQEIIERENKIIKLKDEIYRIKETNNNKIGQLNFSDSSYILSQALGSSNLTNVLGSFNNSESLKGLGFLNPTSHISSQIYSGGLLQNNKTVKDDEE